MIIPLIILSHQTLLSLKSTLQKLTFLFLLSISISSLLLFVSLHRNIQNADIQCHVLEEAYHAYQGIMKKEPYFLLPVDDIVMQRLQYFENTRNESGVLLGEDSSIEELLLNAHEPPQDEARLQEEGLRTHLNEKGDSPFNARVNDPAAVDGNSTTATVSNQTFPVHSIAKWNQYFGLWRLRNHLLNVSKAMGCSTAAGGENTTFTPMWNSTPHHQFLEESENSTLPLYPFILKLHLHTRDSLLPEVISSYVKARAKFVRYVFSPLVDLNRVYNFAKNTTFVSRFLSAQRMWSASSDYYFTMEEGFLHLRQRYGVAMLQVNVSLSHPMIESIFEQSYIPSSLQRIAFTLNPSILGHDAIVNNIFLQQARLLDSRDVGFLYADHSRKIFNLRKYSRSRPSFSIYSIMRREFYNDNLAPILFYIMLFCAEAHIMQSSQKHIMQCLRRMDQFARGPTASLREMAGTVWDMGWLQLHYFLVHFPLICGLFHFIYSFMANRELAVLFISAIWSAQCFSSPHSHNELSTLFVEFINVLAVCFLCYMRIFQATGLHYVAFFVFGLASLCVATYFVFFVRGFLRRRVRFMHDPTAELMHHLQTAHNDFVNHQQQRAGNTRTSQNTAPQLVVQFGEGHNQSLNLNISVGENQSVMNLRVEMNSSRDRGASPPPENGAGDDAANAGGDSNLIQDHEIHAEDDELQVE